jgi:hypothetical protein
MVGFYAYMYLSQGFLIWPVRLTIYLMGNLPRNGTKTMFYLSHPTRMTASRERALAFSISLCQG